MTLSRAINLLFRLVQAAISVWFIFEIVDRFRTDGWRSGLGYLAFLLLAAALWIAAIWWFHRLPEPVERDWSKE